MVDSTAHPNTTFTNHNLSSKEGRYEVGNKNNFFPKQENVFSKIDSSQFSEKSKDF